MCYDMRGFDAMEDIKLRKIKKDDREKIMLILFDVGLFIEEEVEVAISLVDEYFKGDRDYDFLIATCNEQVIGFACYGPTPLTIGTWDVYWIVILKEFQRKQIGSILLKEVENEIQKRNGRLILIETSSKKSYEPTRRFYEKMNYEIVANIDKYYSEQDDLRIDGKYLVTAVA